MPSRRKVLPMLMPLLPRDTVENITALYTPVVYLDLNVIIL